MGQVYANELQVNWAKGVNLNGSKPTPHDVTAAWRKGAALVGLMAENAAGLGDIEKIDRSI